MKLFERTLDGIASIQVPDLHTETFIPPLKLYPELCLYDKIDVITYTFDLSLVVPSIKFGRVIACKLVNFVKEDKQKFPILLVGNVHAKMIIGYVNNKVKHVYVGSWNFTRSRVDIMMLVQAKEHKSCLDYFNKQWQQGVERKLVILPLV